jgi:hypothetical protein
MTNAWGWLKQARGAERKYGSKQDVCRLEIFYPSHPWAFFPSSYICAVAEKGNMRSVLL